MHTLEKNLIDRLSSEVDNPVATVDTRIHDAILAAMDELILSRVKLGLKSVRASSEWERYVLHWTQNIEISKKKRWNLSNDSLKVSSRLTSNADLKTYEIGGKITAEAVELLVNEKKFDRQTHTHRRLPFIFIPRCNHWYLCQIFR